MNSDDIQKLQETLNHAKDEAIASALSESESRLQKYLDGGGSLCLREAYLYASREAIEMSTAYTNNLLLGILSILIK